MRLALGQFARRGGIIDIFPMGAQRPVRMELFGDEVESLRYFGMGFSWGGFESLVVSSDLRQSRIAPPWTEEGPLLRFQIGLEDPRDLIADLAQAFEVAGRVRA